MTETTDILFLPLLGTLGIGLIVFILGCYVLWSAWLNRRVPIFKSLFLVTILLVILNPVYQKTRGTPGDTVVIMAVDQSGSTRLAEYDDDITDTAEQMREAFENVPGIKLKQVNLSDSGSDLLSAIQDEVGSVSPSQLGGVLMITDGQIVSSQKPSSDDVPYHTILAGGDDQRTDRRLKILKAPSYAKIGQTLPAQIRIDDPVGDRSISLSVELDGKTLQTMDLQTNQDHTIDIPVERAGPSRFVLRVPVREDEISPVNNTAVIETMGVRERLRVLLVSGQPHQGLRIWRNLLKSDPSVDLIHFTILRAFDSVDMTPPNELALIPFPTEELFEQRIDDFDLIIMDRYTRRNILAPHYYDNIVRFVKEGGGLLFVHGSEETNSENLSQSALLEIMPARLPPDREAVQSGEYLVEKTQLGQVHPVTSSLLIPANRGQWYRNLISGDVSQDTVTLLQNDRAEDLLYLRQVAEGRVAQFMTDQIWLWARGHDDGGPYTMLMKRLAHWLMKEPGLEYQPLRMSDEGDYLAITYDEKSENQLMGQSNAFNLTLSSRQSLDLKAAQLGREGRSYQAQYNDPLPGYYEVAFQEDRAEIVLGDLNADEVQILGVNADIAEQIAVETNGQVLDLQNVKNIDVVLSESATRGFSNGDLPFRTSRLSENQTIESRPLLPWWAAFPIAALLLLNGWRRQE